MKIRFPFPTILIVFALVAASCGGDETEPTTTAPPLTTLPPATTTTTTPTTTRATTTTTTLPELAASPLNGVGVEDETLLDRRVIAVKVDNHWNARPQSGVEQADAVYELLVEGGLTRFIALFLQSDVEYIGPIRSVRPTDPTLLTFLGAPLQMSGGQDWVQSIVRGHGVKLIGEGSTTFRISSRRAPHNLYGSTPRMREYADGRDWPDDSPPPWFAFGEPSPTEGTATKVTMNWSAERAAVVWEWDGERYLRFNRSDPHTWIDRDGNQDQLSFETLVVIEARKYTARPSSGKGSAVPALETVGTGEASAFYNGEYVTGTWQRGSVDDPFRITLADGSDLVLPPGRLLVAIFPSNRTVSWE